MDRLNCVIYAPCVALESVKRLLKGEGDAFGTDMDMDVHTCYSVAPVVIVTVMADI